MVSIYRLFAPVLLVFLLAAGNCFAAEASSTRSLPDKPSKDAERVTAVAVEYEGTDSIGARLALRLKERFNASSLFHLNERDVPKVRVLLSTVPEFPGRPNVGSAYSVVWAFSQSEGTLRHYLAREVGVVTPDEVDGLADRLVERTDGIAVKYNYLFQ